jgi:hypothetical protein
MSPHETGTLYVRVTPAGRPAGVQHWPERGMSAAAAQEAVTVPLLGLTDPSDVTQ